MNIVTKFQVPIFKNDEVRGGVRGLRGIGLNSKVNHFKLELFDLKKGKKITYGEHNENKERFTF